MTYKTYQAIYGLAVWSLAFVLLMTSGCSIITKEDRDLAEKITRDGSGCIYIQGSGGAATLAIPPLPAGGGYGQGSLMAARSNDPGRKVTCGPEGATVE